MTLQEMINELTDAAICAKNGAEDMQDLGEYWLELIFFYEQFETKHSPELREAIEISITLAYISLKENFQIVEDEITTVVKRLNRI